MKHFLNSFLPKIKLKTLKTTSPEATVGFMRFAVSRPRRRDECRRCSDALCNDTSAAPSHDGVDVRTVNYAQQGRMEIIKNDGRRHVKHKDERLLITAQE